jgi:hypothetical protein
VNLALENLAVVETLDCYMERPKLAGDSTYVLWIQMQGHSYGSGYSERFLDSQKIFCIYADFFARQFMQASSGVAKETLHKFSFERARL